MARDMMARDPALAADIQTPGRHEPGLREGSGSAAGFLYKRHPSYDKRLNLYPVLRIQSTRP